MNICGIDEVGRGCLCGPVTAACVLFPPHFSPQSQGFSDSKTLAEIERVRLALIIRTKTIWGLGWAYPHEIDEINIHHASLLAMQRAFMDMYCHSRNSTYSKIQDSYHVMIDGKFTPELIIDNLVITKEAIVKGDSKIEEIKAASILAKTTRDTHMRMLDKTFPQYGLSKHKGYPTLFHKKALHHYGHNCIYRQSFKLSYNITI